MKVPKSYVPYWTEENFHVMVKIERYSYLEDVALDILKRTSKPIC